VGAAIDGDWVVQKIQAKEVSIGPRGEGAVVTLALASLPPAATGTLPSSGGAGNAVAPVVARPGFSPAPPPQAPPPPPVADAMAPGAVLPAPPKLPGSMPGESNQDPNADAPPVMPTLSR
jgi:hypothetical protein